MELSKTSGVIWTGTAVLLLTWMGTLAGCGDNPQSPSEGTVESTVPDSETYHEATRGAEGDSLATFPDTGLVNQAGEPVSFEQFLGRPVVLSAVYTRCPQPNMCPLQTSKMVRLQKRLRDQAARDVQFVLVSFDPGYDTPAVLRQYGGRYNLNYHHWSLVTGDTATVQDLMKRMNVTVARPEAENPSTIVHNLRLLVIDQGGVVQRVFEQSDWDIQAVEEVIQDTAYLS